MFDDIFCEGWTTKYGYYQFELNYTAYAVSLRIFFRDTYKDNQEEIGWHNVSKLRKTISLDTKQEGEKIIKKSKEILLKEKSKRSLVGVILHNSLTGKRMGMEIYPTKEEQF